MAKVKVRVTAKCIASGERSSSAGCPVALALQDVIDHDRCEALVAVDCVVFSDDKSSMIADVNLPRKVVEWIAAFDRSVTPRTAPKPFAFELRLPDAVPLRGRGKK